MDVELNKTNVFFFFFVCQKTRQRRLVWSKSWGKCTLSLFRSPSLARIYRLTDANGGAYDAALETVLMLPHVLRTVCTTFANSFFVPSSPAFIIILDFFETGFIFHTSCFYTHG